jgi:cation diffusion facilitator family transporter
MGFVPADRIVESMAPGEPYIHADHSHDEQPRPGLLGLVDRFRHSLPHDHDAVDGAGALIDTGAEGIRATKVSLVGLGITAVLQAVLVVLTGSVALLSDTLHNLTDALTAIPLWIAFSLGRRAPTKRFTYGYNRAEDLAGIVIVIAIAASAGAVAWESIQRFLEPRDLTFPGWVIAAGIIGALGNEAVARYRINAGKRIHSAALIADGVHARTDAYTSLSVVAAGIGSLLGWRWADPLAGLVVAAMILYLLRGTAARMFGRILDAVDPGLVERATAIVRSVPGVEEVTDLRLRWAGHRLHATISVAVDPAMTVGEGHDIALDVSRDLTGNLPYAVESTVHIDPAGTDGSHDSDDARRLHPDG